MSNDTSFNTEMRRVGAWVPASVSRVALLSTSGRNASNSTGSAKDESKGGATYPFMHKDKSSYPTNQYDRVARIILVWRTGG